MRKYEYAFLRRCLYESDLLRHTKTIFGALVCCMVCNLLVGSNSYGQVFTTFGFGGDLVDLDPGDGFDFVATYENRSWSMQFTRPYQDPVLISNEVSRWRLQNRLCWLSDI